MATHNEVEFEKEICEYLADRGWLYSINDQGYDRERALFPADVFGWLEESQPEAYSKAVKPNGDVAKQQAQLLDRLVATLDLPLDNGGGMLSVLRTGFQVIGAGKLSMATFKPETALNAAENEKFAKMRVRVMRQVHFSPTDERSIDLVLFINGLPVATLELKTDFTQSIDNAIEQYKKDRIPDGTYKGVKSGGKQPLLGFGNRALVHFAVSNSEVWMTTKLAGAKTYFLPFNIGHEGGKGNPPATYVEGEATTSATAYLWERVLEKDAWLNIIGKMMMVETSTAHDPITGEVKKNTTLLFPRFHQWEVVTGLTQAAIEEGPGNRYLIQHSAGSGKTNSIAWIASRLARLQQETNGDWGKVFDKVIVVVDRNVLDGQLQDAIRKIDGAKDALATINEDDVRKAGAKSKSDLLAKALLNQHSHIIAVTIQTFPFAMDAVRSNSGLSGKKFAVIADEAHSSQSGQIASKLKAVLSAEELKDIEDGGEIDVEAVLASETASRAESGNISYFAFTATPKAKTLELFGRKGDDGKPVPFHVYSMKQAIEEEFILDVLRGYQTYDTAFQIAQGAEGGSTEEVDQSAATKGLMKWVRLHPTNISQKVRIIVEHFHTNVVDLLDGHAKAMVVTDSRKAAVRYKLAIDAYIAKRLAEDPSYDYRTLVAFSGAVDDPETGPEPFTEASMNPGLFDLAKAFQGEKYKVMLVANKFQTGFDQPLLCAMYVDKKLSGVTAVQTLSRLNRTYRTPGGERKSKTFVLDFVNKAEDIKAAFEPYFTDAFVETETDHYVVVNIATKLAQSGIYTEDEVRKVAETWLLRKGNNVLMAAISAPKYEFEVRYKAALDQKDKTAQDSLDTFRKDVGTYVRLYDFMSQIVDYGAEFERLSIFLRLLSRVISEESWAAEIDLSDVTLQSIKQVKRDQTDISLSGGAGLAGATGAGSATSKDPKMVALREVIEKLNDLFSGTEYAEADNQSFVETVLRRLLMIESIKQQIKVNSPKQFAESPALNDLILEAISDTQGEHNKRADYFFGTGVEVDAVMRSMKTTLYEWGQDDTADTPA